MGIFRNDLFLTEDGRRKTEDGRLKNNKSHLDFDVRTYISK